MSLLDQRVAANACTYCGEPAEGNYAVHEFDDYTGREVPLCDAHGSEQTPTLASIWSVIAWARTQPAV